MVPTTILVREVLARASTVSGLAMHWILSTGVGRVEVSSFYPKIYQTLLCLCAAHRREHITLMVAQSVKHGQASTPNKNS